VYPLKEIMVTATRSQKNPDEVGRSVTVITADQMNNSTYQSVGELLGQQEGIYMVGTGQNPGTNQSIFMRGTASNQTAIMIDNVRFTDPATPNSAPDLSELSSLGVDQIEIVRGSHSTLYGSSAMGGVINLITREGSNTPGIHADADIATGTFGTKTSELSENLLLNYTDNKGFYCTAGFDNLATKGLDATIDTVTNRDTLQNRHRDNFAKADGFGKLGYQTDELNVYFSYRNTAQKADLPHAAFEDDPDFTSDVNRNFYTYGASYKIADDIQLKYIGGYSNLKRTIVDDSSMIFPSTYSDDTYKGTMGTNEIQTNYKDNTVDAVIGIGLYKETMTASTYYYNSVYNYVLSSDIDSLNINSLTKSIFFHFDINGPLTNPILSHFALAGGTRLADQSSFGTNVTYEINPSYKIAENSLLYCSYSTGFNAPSLYELFSPNRDGYDLNISLGNKNLKPENSTSYEIGVKQSVGNGMSFSFAYFSTEVKHYIDYVYLWNKNIDSLEGDTYLNIGIQTSSGIELTVKDRLSTRLFFESYISFITGSLTYNPSDINSSQTGGNTVQLFSNGAFLTNQVQSMELVRRPSTANASLTYLPIDRLVLKVDVKIVGARNDTYYDSNLGPYGALASIPLSSYTVMDFSQRFIVNNDLFINGKIENVFNVQYSEILGYTSRGRGFYLSVNYRI
jgi:vitamin B12 transporter